MEPGRLSADDAGAQGGGGGAAETTLLVALERLVDAAVVHAAAQSAEKAARLRAALRRTPAEIVARFARCLRADCAFRHPAPLPHVARADGMGHSAPYIIEHAMREMRALVSEVLETLRKGSAPPLPPSNAHWKKRFSVADSSGAAAAGVDSEVGKR